MKFSLIIIFIIATCKLSAIDKTTYYSYGNEFDASIYILPHNSDDSIRVVFPFRILFDLLSFKEEYTSEKESIYSSEIELELICTDEGGIIRNRTHYVDTCYAKSFEETNSKSIYQKGFIDINLAKSNYSCELNLLDKSKKQTKKLRIRNDEIVIKEDMIFYRETNENNLYNLKPYIIQNSALYDNNKTAILLNTKELNVEYYYTIDYISKNEDAGFYRFWSEEKIKIDGKAEILKNKDLKFDKNLSDISFNIVSGSNNFLKISLPFEKIIPGEYKLKVYSENGDTLTSYFKIEWESKPLSLDNIKYAIDKMYYILTDEEVENMKEGDEFEIENKFMNYWKKLDPTPSTPFNESMFQYFSRVDYAFFNFATLAEKDGADTDRGKIFILNGPPDSITDTNVEGKPGFYWEYKNLKQRFIFKSISSGIFKLIKIEETNPNN